jgi:hypothetical protein
MFRVGHETSDERDRVAVPTERPDDQPSLLSKRLGASLLYGRKIIVFRERGVSFPSLHSGEHVLVGLDGEGGVGVSEAFGHDLDRDVGDDWFTVTARMGSPVTSAGDERTLALGTGGGVLRR